MLKMCPHALLILHMHFSFSPHKNSMQTLCWIFKTILKWLALTPMLFCAFPLILGFGRPRITHPRLQYYYYCGSSA